MDSMSSKATGLVFENCAEAHTITSNHENQEQTDALSAPFRFLDLPVEIRLRIYRHLAPNTPTPPFRDDGPCCPAILRTNQTIYEESMAEWYSLMPYRASIARSHFQIFKLWCSPDDQLPRMFHAIRSLDLTIMLEKVPMPGGPKCDPAPHVALHQLSHACFPSRPTGSSNLRRVRVELGVMLPFFVAYRDQPDHLRRALDDNVIALHNLRGLVKVTITIRFARVVDQICGLKCPTAPLYHWKMEFMAILRAFSKDLEILLSA